MILVAGVIALRTESTMLSELAYLGETRDSDALAAGMSRTSPGLAAEWWLNLGSPRLRYAYLRKTRRDEALSRKLADAALVEAEQALKDGSQSPRPLLEIAAVHSLNGEVADGFEWLEKAYTSGWRDYRGLALNPIFKNLRSDQR
jgi:hypothetical protein